MPTRDRFPARLHTQIRIVCDVMLKTRRFDEAHWLWMSVGSIRDCHSRAARDALRSAAAVARQCGFPDVVEWIYLEVLPPVE